ncbi:hypothetical protein [Pseudomonas serbica]|uniref:hypothetical protein n=1 Tax=Pseudomonas serbica TaxID=2965074 RepID=UPI00237B1EC4|nr:hypothetical protein [Pseudomonas serbica]
MSFDQQTTQRKGIYIASRASIPERSAAWRRLREVGWDVRCSWIDATGESELDDLGGLWHKIQGEVCSAERLILYVEPDDFPLKGALVEVGMALAVGVKVYVVAPGVKIDPETYRPLGSWAFHPNVKIVQDIAAALQGASRETDLLNRFLFFVGRYLDRFKSWLNRLD